MSDQTSIKKLVEAIRSAIGRNQFSVANLFPILVSAIEVAETFAMNGSGKKSLVVQAFDIIIDDYVSDPITAGLIKEIIPTAIDTAVALTKGAFDINKVKGCWARIKCCK